MAEAAMPTGRVALVVVATLITALIAGPPADANETSVVAPGGNVAEPGSKQNPFALPEGEAFHTIRVGGTVWFSVTIQENQVARLQAAVVPVGPEEVDVLDGATLRLTTTRPRRLQASPPCTRSEGPASVPDGQRLALGTRRAEMNLRPTACDGSGRHLFAVHLDGPTPPDGTAPAMRLTVIASVVGSPEPAPVQPVGDAGPPTGSSGDPAQAAGSGWATDASTALAGLVAVVAVLFLARRRRTPEPVDAAERPSVRIEPL